MIKTTNSCPEWTKAREYFGIADNPNMVLHHIDETLRHTNIDRYNQWLPEDLVVMTRAEHASYHHKNKPKPCNNETRQKISSTLKGRVIAEDVKNRMAEGHKKPIMCIETGEIYDGLIDAKNKLGRSVNYSLKTGGKTLGKHFIYLQKETN